MATKMGGFLTLKIHLLTGRLVNRIISDDGRALYNAEQGKIMSALWLKHPQTSSELAKSTGLAMSSLTLMLKRLENEQKLIVSLQDKEDKRKKWLQLTDLGASQQEVGDQISERLGNIFYDGFEDAEIEQFESMLVRVLNNLETAMEEPPTNQKEQ